MDGPPPPVYQADVPAPEVVGGFSQTKPLTGEQTSHTLEDTMLQRLENIEKVPGRDREGLLPHRAKTTALPPAMIPRLSEPTSQSRFARSASLYETSLAAARPLEKLGNLSAEDQAKSAELRQRANWALDAYEVLIACLYVREDVDFVYRELCRGKPSWVGPVDVDNGGADLNRSGE